MGNGGKWALNMIAAYIIVAYLNALLRYVQVPVLSVIMSVFGVTLLKLIPIVMMGLWILRTTYMAVSYTHLDVYKRQGADSLRGYEEWVRLPYRRFHECVEAGTDMAGWNWSQLSVPEKVCLLYTSRFKKCFFLCSTA